MSWQTYYNQFQKEIALKLRPDTPIEYGDVIYESPMVREIRWLVINFKDEYNVFVDQITEFGKIDRILCASFTWKDRALEFALEMFLVYTGRLRRKDKY